MLLFKLIILCLAAYIVLCGLLFSLRWKLIFFPTQANPFLIYPWRKNKLSVSYQNIPLQGWLLEDPDVKNKPFLLYFGGNAEGFAHRMVNALKFEGASILFMSYPGYDDAPGKPSERKVFSYALAAYDYLVHVRHPARSNFSHGKEHRRLRRRLCSRAAHRQRAHLNHTV